MRQRDSAGHFQVEHGHAGRVLSPIYRVWMGMVNRCSDPNTKHWHRYGGRGITVCERWKLFENFLADMEPIWFAGATIDRFPNNDGNYEPGNCRWATAKEQSRNRRTNRLLTINGETAPLIVWAQRAGINERSLESRLMRGWSEERAVLTKTRVIKRRAA